MIGIINIYKPKGITSSNVVVKIKKILNMSKVGHMGTLDPLAEGVLPICIGKATRLFDYFLKKKKTYETIFEFGKQTTTLDLEGEIEKVSENIPQINEVNLALNCFKGKILQIPPNYSSKKINGKMASELVRKGKEIELKPCSIEIFEFDLIEKIDDKSFKFKITCSAGTYIRALCRDLAVKLNSCATMTSLVRIKSGPFDIKNSVKLDELDVKSIKNNLISIEEVLNDYKKIEISKETLKNLLDGKKVLYYDVVKNNNVVVVEDLRNFTIYCENKLIGIAKIDNNYIKVKTYLCENFSF